MNALYETMLEKAVVINHLRGADIFSVIAEMMEALVTEGVLNETQEDEAKQSVVRREMSASTIMMDEIALPHGRTDVVNDLVCAVGIHREGFAADAPDGAPTRVVILMLVPPSAGSGYTTFLANLSRALMDPEKRAKMIAAEDRATVLAVLKS
ncbi:MAG: PTS sugar transporter subunit IIA [Kiritimatiellia bacterium]